MNRARCGGPPPGWRRWLRRRRPRRRPRSSSGATPATAPPTSPPTPPPCSPAPGSRPAAFPGVVPDAGRRLRRPRASAPPPASMVTASHNPPADNGYKVYAGDGAQIVPPMDAEIAARIDARHVGHRRSPARPDGGARRLRRRHRPSYVERASSTSAVDRARDAPHRLHADARRRARRGARGCSRPPASRRRRSSPPAGRPRPRLPDRRRSRTPRSPGAMDLLLGPGPAPSGADVAIANDPDADRLAVAVPDADARRRLAAPHRRRDRRAARRLAPRARRHRARDRLVATTIVSSSLLSASWPPSTASPTSRRSPASSGWPGPPSPGPHLPPGLRLRGGARLLRRRRRARQGRHLGGHGLRRAGRPPEGATAAPCSTASTTSHRRHGVHRTAQRSVRYDGPDATDRARAVVDRLADRAAGVARRPAGRSPSTTSAPGFGGLPPSDVVRLHLDGARVLVRPSRHRAQAQGLRRGRRCRVDRPTTARATARRRAAAGSERTPSRRVEATPARHGRRADSAAGLEPPSSAHAVPNRRSPASPRPGTMKAWSLRWSSMAAVTTWTPRPERLDAARRPRGRRARRRR